jgi:cytochrome c553
MGPGSRPSASAGTTTALGILISLLNLLPLPVVAQPVQEKLAPCLACHGENGQSQTPEVPSLGGQPGFYLLAQILMFRERMRAIEPMTQMLQGASDADLRAMADALARLPPPQPDTTPADPGRTERALALIQRNRCNVCHLPNFAGIENVPRIAGQREDYLIKSLRGYKDNSRRGYDTQMADVAEPLSDADFVDLAHYLARQK